MKPQELLEELRGANNICGCGKPLIKIEGGVTHETFEDEDYHVEYFRHLRIEPNK